MAHDEKMLCPFKKGFCRNQNLRTGEMDTTERFMPCAGERCMAYRPGHPPRCIRLEDPGQKPPRTLTR